jgi:hypothetical protein
MSVTERMRRPGKHRSSCRRTSRVEKYSGGGRYSYRGGLRAIQLVVICLYGVYAIFRFSAPVSSTRTRANSTSLSSSLFPSSQASLERIPALYICHLIVTEICRRVQIPLTMFSSLSLLLGLIALSRAYTTSENNCLIPAAGANFVFSPDTRGTLDILVSTRFASSLLWRDRKS